MADDNMSGLGWFLAGLGIGALVGVLYAPKSGRETREDLAAQARDAKEKANQYVEQGRDQINDYVDKGREYYDKGRTQWSQYVDKGKEYLSQQQDKVASAVDTGKQIYQEKVESQTY
ncbi:YtxH domain-containing protein [Terriglobus sp. ADX1]|uniref:YtxH domain-containing protein n=1 Tax=Terriglobus sp. ADX1 TaxID=2794063 RepID=UPI002FE52A3A